MGIGSPPIILDLKHNWRNVGVILGIPVSELITVVMFSKISVKETQQQI